MLSVSACLVVVVGCLVFVSKHQRWEVRYPKTRNRERIARRVNYTRLRAAGHGETGFMNDPPGDQRVVPVRVGKYRYGIVCQCRAGFEAAHDFEPLRFLRETAQGGVSGRVRRDMEQTRDL